MKLTLTRRWETDKSIIGMIDINGLMFSYSLERSRTGDHPCIPEGTYPITINFSERHQKPMPEICNVPGRTGIRFDIANYPEQLLGCVAVGSSRGLDAVFSSTAAWDQLYGKIETSLNSGEAVTIDIVKAGSKTS